MNALRIPACGIEWISDDSPSPIHAPIAEPRPAIAVSDPGRRVTLSGLFVVSAGLVLAAMPIFMIGGLAVQIRADLGLDESALGAAVTIGFAAGAISATWGGRLADRIGPRAALYIGAGLSTVASVGLGLVAHTWAALVVFLSLAGLSVAVIDPGLAILVGRTFRPDRQGLAFGIKEASIPGASLLAGLAVPAIALTVGWRWAFALAGVPLLVLLVLLPRVSRVTLVPGGTGPGHVGSSESAPSHRRVIALAAVAGALGTAAASGVGVFLTESAVAMGMSEAGAGYLLAGGSLAGIIARITAGVGADRRGGTQFKLISVMLAFGAVAVAFGGTGSTALLVLGAIGAFTGAWAWTGIFFLSLVRTDPARPGAVAGIGAASLGVGNATGPILFGVVAESASFGLAWAIAGLTAGVAALLMALAHRSLGKAA